MHDLGERIIKTREALQSFQKGTGVCVQNLIESIKDYDVDSSNLDEKSYTRIALAGSFSSGKSSFINSLLDKEGLAPVSSSPSTRVITRFTYGDSLKCFDCDGKEISLEEYQQSAIRERATDTKDNVFVIQYPAQFLKNIVLSDVPGFDSGDEHQADSAVSRKENENADIIILLTRIDKGTIQEHVFSELLGDGSEKTGILNAGQNQKKLYVVITQADLKSFPAREIVKKSVEKALVQHGIVAEKVCLYATQYKKEEDKPRFEALKKELCENIASNVSYSSDLKRSRLNAKLQQKMQWAEQALSGIAEQMKSGRDVMINAFYQNNSIPNYAIYTEKKHFKEKYEDQWNMFQKFINNKIDDLDFCEVRRSSGILFDDYAVRESNWKKTWSGILNRCTEYVDENIDLEIRPFFRVPQNLQEFKAHVYEKSYDYDIFGNDVRDGRYNFCEKQNKELRKQLKKYIVCFRKDMSDKFNNQMISQFCKKEILEYAFNPLFDEVLNAIKG